MTVVRRAVWRPGPDNGWHDELVWYAAGVAAMKALTPGIEEFIQISLTGNTGSAARTRLVALSKAWGDPASWGYQSQVHGAWGSATSWPRYRSQRAIWNECAHENWFFLPWHRAFLLEFEAVVREHIVRLGGPAEWGLPYWNYSDYQATPAALGLPKPLRGEFVPADVVIPGVDPGPDGRVRNPLFNPIRVYQGDLPAGARRSWADAGLCLSRPHYANQVDTNVVSFGGGVVEPPVTPAKLHRTNEMGMLDASPHGAVHGQVGGAMNMFETAGLDPVFWLHHCNVDRLWETYARDLGHQYPFDNGVGVGTESESSWRTQKFRFLRTDGSIAIWTAPQMVGLSGLGYGYDTTAAPRVPLVPAPAGSEVDPFGLDVPHPEPVSSAEDLTLAGGTEVSLLGGGSGDRALTVADFPAGSTWQLRFDGITSRLPVANSYDVIIAGGSNQTGEVTESADAGVLSLFGVCEASRDDGVGSGGGATRRLDVTAALTAVSGVHPLNLRVTLVPTAPERDVVPVVISRVTLEVS